MDEINPLSKFLSPLIWSLAAKIPFPFRGSFAVQSGDYFRSWDHLRSNLGIICGTGIIYGPGSFAGRTDHCCSYKSYMTVSKVILLVFSVTPFKIKIKTIQ